MKKVILFITLFSMISLFSYSKNPVKQWGQLQVKGNPLLGSLPYSDIQETIPMNYIMYESGFRTTPV